MEKECMEISKIVLLLTLTFSLQGLYQHANPLAQRVDWKEAFKTSEQLEFATDKESFDWHITNIIPNIAAMGFYEFLSAIEHLDSRQKKKLLHDAVSGGFISVVRALLDNGVDIEYEESFQKTTALILAAYYGSVDVVRLLLQHHANVNHANMFRNTPLMIACGYGHREVVRLLLQHGARVDIVSNYGKTAHDWASHNDTYSRHTPIDPEIIALLDEQKKLSNKQMCILQ